jgi:hypothetical protein
MILHKKNLAYPEVILYGMLTWIIGLFFSMLSDSPLVDAWLGAWFANPSWVDFFQGLFAGLALGLFSFSIFINVRGYCTYRRSGSANR